MIGNRAERWTASGSIHKRDGGNQNQAFVGGGIEALAKGEKDKSCKHHHVSEGNDVERSGIEARTWRGESPPQRIAAGQTPITTIKHARPKPARPRRR